MTSCPCNKYEQITPSYRLSVNYSTPESGIAGRIMVIDLDELWTFISVPFELEQVEFGILIPAIALPEKSQKECGPGCHV